MGKEQRISFREEQKTWKALGLLYQEFKSTDITLDEYEQRREELTRPLLAIEKRFSDLLSLEKALLKETNENKELTGKKVRHERIHEEIAIFTAAKMGIEQLTIEFGLIPRYDNILLIGPAINTAPTTEIIFPNLAKEAGSKERYIEFLDKVAEHPDPSPGDNVF